MSVKMTTRQVGDVTVIDAAGRITLGRAPARSATLCAIWQPRETRKSCST